MDSPRRKPRADALRNRARLIEAAKEILGRGGPGASLEAVARNAGVGIGTLYRHFPAREDLFKAVYQREVEQLIELAGELEMQGGGPEALRTWLRARVELVETKRGLLGALAVVANEESKVMFAEISSRMTKAVDGLIAPAKAAGVFRADISADDLLSTVYALCYARPPELGWKDRVLHLLDIFVDGLRAE